MDAETRDATIQRLGDAMSDLQEACLCASWMCVTPTIVGLCRRAIRTDTRQLWGNGELAVRTAREMWSMAEAIGGWVEPDRERSDARSVHYGVNYPFTPLESEGLPGEDVESWMSASAEQDIAYNEVDLAEKLLRTLHLSVPERRRLPDGRIHFGTLVDAARRYLGAGHTLPEGWLPGGEGDGVVIERRDDEFWLHERNEIGVLRYSPVRSWKAANLVEAVRYFVRYFGKDGQIDGVPIDFES